jgi:nucleoside-diphosphate-sugar epimerase
VWGSCAHGLFRTDRCNGSSCSARLPCAPSPSCPAAAQTRSFQYVDDLIRGMVAVMEGDELGPFNVGNPGEFTMLELAEVRGGCSYRLVAGSWGGVGRGVCSCYMAVLQARCGGGAEPSGVSLPTLTWLMPVLTSCC